MLTRRRLEAVDFLLCLAVGSVCLLRCIEIAKEFALVADLDAGLPFLLSLLPAHAEKAGGVVLVLGLVLVVFGMNTGAKVIGAVVRSVAVPVVNVVLWKSTVDVQPRKPMGVVADTEQANLDVAVPHLASGNLPGSRALAGADFPGENARLWIVMQSSLKLLLGESFFHVQPL